MLTNVAQLDDVLVGQQANTWVLQLLLAQRRRVHPTPFGVEQPTGWQGHPGDGFGLGALQRVQQVVVEGGGQFALAFGLLGVEGQLQHAAGIPVLATLQALELAPRVAEPGQNHLRQRGAMGRQLEVQHPLRVARSFLGRGFVALQHSDLPATPGQAGSGCAAGEPGTDHQRFARPLCNRWACVPGGFGAGDGADVGAAHHLPLLADAWHLLHGEASFDQAAAYPAGGGERAQHCARVR